MDQRRWAAAYVDVLCQLDGAPPARTLVSWIAQQLGVSDRSLQQFLNRSAWDPGPICQETSTVVHELLSPTAWVVRDVCFSRHGQQMAGVARQFVPEFNRVVNCQQSLAIFAATSQDALPLCWHLRMPPEWSSDQERWDRARIPSGVEARSRVDDVLLVLARAEAAGTPPEGPVVVDGGPPRACVQLARELLDHEFPFVIRVDPGLVVADVGPGRQPAPLTLAELAEREKVNLEPATWRGSDGVLRRSKFRSLDVAVPLWSGRGPHPLRLLVEWPLGRPEPAGLWLTDLDAGLEELIGITRTPQAVDSTVEDMRARFALDAFEGRTYHGWHHHVALSSCAYVLSRWEAARKREQAVPATVRLGAVDTTPEALAAHLTHLTRLPDRPGRLADRGAS